MTANRRRTSRKPRMTEGQRQARREADAALVEAANTRLDGDEAGAELADWIRARPALARLSIKNIALLAEQAEARGADVADVQTYREWQARGRQVKQGAKAYKLTVPYRRDDKRTDEEGQDREPKPEEGKKKPPRFYLKAGWFDVGQTEGIEDFEPTVEAPAPVPADEDEAAAALFASLTAQAERAGYQIQTHPENERGTGARVDVDDDEEAPTIHVYAPDVDADAEAAWSALGDLAQTVAGLSADHRRPSQREDRASGGPVLDIL